MRRPHTKRRSEQSQCNQQVSEKTKHQGRLSDAEPVPQAARKTASPFRHREERSAAALQTVPRWIAALGSQWRSKGAGLHLTDSLQPNFDSGCRSFRNA